MTLSTVTALARLFGQYLLQPIPFALPFLALLFTLTQLAAMAVFVWILQAAAKNSR